VDECTWAPSVRTHSYGAFKDHAWAPVGRPHYFAKRKGDQPQIHACAAISSESGWVHRLVREATEQAKGLRSADVVAVLESIRATLGTEKKIAVFWNNASIHSSKLVKEAALELRIPLVFNLPYRPDLIAFENIWRLAKPGTGSNTNPASSAHGAKNNV